MNFVKSGRAAAVLASTLAVISLNVLAQAPAPGMAPPPGGMGMGMGTMDRPGMIQRLGLDDPSLKLSASQTAEINKIVDGFLAEQKDLRDKSQASPGNPPGPEMMTAMQANRAKLNTAVGKVLDDRQRSSWQAAMKARGPMGAAPPAPR